MSANSAICTPDSVVALVHTPTSISAARNARTTSKNCGWIVGSPPVSVIRRTRHSTSRGMTFPTTSGKGMNAPSFVAETKQCAQRRLHRSSICTSALRYGASIVVRK